MHENIDIRFFFIGEQSFYLPQNSLHGRQEVNVTLHCALLLSAFLFHLISDTGSLPKALDFNSPNMYSTSTRPAFSPYDTYLSFQTEVHSDGEMIQLHKLT